MWALAARLFVSLLVVAAASFIPGVRAVHPQAEAAAFALAVTFALLPIGRDSTDDSSLASDAGHVIYVVAFASSARHARGPHAWYALSSAMGWSWLVHMASDVGFRETAAMDAHSLVIIALSSEPQYAFYCLLFHPVVFGFAIAVEPRYSVLVSAVMLFVVALRPPDDAAAASSLAIFVMVVMFGTILGLSYRSVWNMPTTEWVLSVRGAALICISLLVVARVFPE